jgi:phosphoribosylanthranilate isomerase
MKIKICGIRDVDTALFAANCGADALGFVFYEPSPRYISPSDAKKICDLLPPFVRRVGLFVQCSAGFVNNTCSFAGLDMAQIHFDADDSFYDALTTPFLRVVRAKSIEDISKHSCEYRFVDSYVDGFGGEGKRLELDWFDQNDNSKIILAGGLTPSNVPEVLKYGFYGVDVSSGVESSKGVKDKVLIKNFIESCM